MYPCPALKEEIATQRGSIVEAMLDFRDLSVPTPIQDARQFILGFLHVVEHAAEGDLETRDEYLFAVIPGLRDSGFPLDATLESMIRVSMVLATGVRPEHRHWVVDFCGDYVRRLAYAWEHTR